MNKLFLKLLDFFSSGNMLRIPPGLDKRKGDSEKIERCKSYLFDIMKKCWCKDASDRIGPKEIVRDLNTFSSTYGEQYHVYEEIPEECSMELLSAATSASGIAIGGIEINNVPHILDELKEKEEKFESSGTSSLAPHTPPVASVPKINPPTRAGRNELENVRDKLMMPKSIEIRSQRSIPGAPTIPLPSTPVPESPISQLKYLIDHRRVLLDNHGTIGKGHYGVVKKGRLFASVMNQNHSFDQIAAKCLKGDFKSVLDDEEFKHEAEVMCSLNHPNVVRFIGICDNMIIMEYVENGSMNNYLRNCKKKKSLLPIANLLEVVTGVAEGMEYIYKKSEKRIIHCDLAGRNILLGKTLIAKITDFGLAKALSQDKDYYTRSVKKELPARWCAPEALARRRFTTKSDVWSYGIVLYEAVTHGDSPYSEWDSEKFDPLRVIRGDKMSKPKACPDDIFDLMMRCWEMEPEDRPEFEEVVAIGRTLLQKYSGETASMAAAQGGAVDITVASVAIETNINPFSTGTKVTSPVDISKTGTNKITTGQDKTNKAIPPASKKEQNFVNKTERNSTLNNAPEQEQKKLVSEKLTKPLTVKIPTNQARVSKLPDGNLATEPSGNLATKTQSPETKSTVTSPQTSVTPGAKVDTQKWTSPAVSPSGQTSPLTSPGSGSATSSFVTSTEIKGRQLPLLPHEDIRYLIQSSKLDIDMTTVLGQGHYGKVYKGRYGDKQIAAKILKEEFREKIHRDEFNEEIDIMARLDHENIVRLIGISIKDCMMVMEYVAKGSLCTYLKKHKKSNNLLPCRQLLEICQDVALGMAYLEQKKIIHCDLAARNVLLTESNRAKISDFGLSKILRENKDYYKRSGDKNIPALWCAPEVLMHNKLTTKGDVWSFGIVIWEAFTHGKSPNICQTEEEMKIINLHLLEKGTRLKQPENCPQDVYELMKKCWDWDPLLRPPFSDIVKAFRIFLGKLDNNEIHTHF